MQPDVDKSFHCHFFIFTLLPIIVIVTEVNSHPPTVIRAQFRRHSFASVYTLRCFNDSSMCLFQAPNEISLLHFSLNKKKTYCQNSRTDDDEFTDAVQLAVVLSLFRTTHDSAIFQLY